MTDTLFDRPRPKPGVLDITAYTPGKSRIEGVADPVKLSSNENILGCSPAALAACQAASVMSHVYPDSRASALRTAVATRYDLEPERLVFGCGTDELFALISQVFLEPGDNIVQGQYGFGAYAIAARANMGQVRYAAEPGLRIDVDEVLACVDERTRLVFIANPANPSGTWIGRDEVERLHRALPPRVLLVLDGAYAEFNRDPGFDDGLDLARGAVNVVVTHTFSKLHGLAALRVGWAYAPAEVADALERVRPPFNTSIAGQAAAIEALADTAFQQQSFEHADRWRQYLSQKLGGLGLEVTPSAANFVLARFPTTPGHTAAEAEAFLAARGYLVRGVAGYGLPEHLRLTVGLEHHNRAVVAALAEFLGREAP